MNTLVNVKISLYSRHRKILTIVKSRAACASIEIMKIGQSRVFAGIISQLRGTQDAVRKFALLRYPA